MSIAEQRAHRLYESYKLGALPHEVKCHLVHLFFTNNMPDEKEELRHRALNAYIDAVEGKSSPAEEMEARLEAKYPWL